MKHHIHKLVSLLLRPIKRVRYEYHLRRTYPDAEKFHIRAAVRAYMHGEGA